MSRRSELRVDIRTVAERARVSIATVSRVINGIDSVNAVMAGRVRRAIAELGYAPNMHARTLVSGRSRLIGLIVTLITNPFYPELIQSFETLAAQHGYDVLIVSTDYPPAHRLDCVRRLEERKVDGIAMMTFGSDEELLCALTALGQPVVAVGDHHPPAVLPLKVDFRSGITEAVQHLAVLGHRRIGFLSGPLQEDTARERQDAFLSAAADIGLRVPRQLLYEGNHNLESGLQGTERLLSLKNAPTAILCSNDMTAIGALHAVYARKLRVPRDISIIGFDDIHMAQFTVPPLTTVRMSGEEIAGAALATLIPLIEHGVTAEQDPVRTRLVVRKSAGYAPGRGRGASLPVRKPAR